ncbi:tetraspanin-1-like isoform X2 [Leptopilina boulardi]|uniref:tetraspanin-1-like isoform X2 n=1 Tax=Leptopilina boulardi TaxID=63433 RepID=UPI0021F62473|nr:tetraspanin-1-like isoform X2 [Leptopilina boulardi]
MGCTSRCAKYFLCFFNFIFFIAGGAALAVGIWLIADKNSFINLIRQIDDTDVLNNTDAHILEMISYILIIAGALTFFVSFLGYCGAMFESRCLLCVYGILILIVLILECVVVGLAFELKGDAEKETQNLLKSTIKYYSGQNDAVTLAWDQIMTQFQCCGVENYNDFKYATNWTQRKTVPEACCKKGGLDSNCIFNPTDDNSNYQTGCFKKLVEAIENNAEIIIGVCAGLVFIEVLVIILALYLACCHWRPQHVNRCVEQPNKE